MMYLNNKQNKLKNEQGYSLVEVLVAITVLLIALVGPLTIAHSGLKRANESKGNTAAVFLAQEGIEAVVKLRENDALNASGYDNLSEVWGDVSSLASLCPVDGAYNCGVLIAEDGTISTGSFYRCSGSNCEMDYSSSARVPYKQGASGEATPYTRYITMTITNEYARVRSEVSWGSDASERIVLESYVYNSYYEP